MANTGRKIRPNYNPFDVLGIKPGCSTSEIDKAFKRSALKWHPDKNPNNIEKAKEMFLKIAEAYDYLKDDSTRIELEEADAAKQRRTQYEEERKATSSSKREHFINKLAERERQAKSAEAQNVTSKRKTREEREAAVERKRARDSSLERLAREAAEMMAQHRAKREAQAAMTRQSDPPSMGNLSAEDFAKLEAEVLEGML